MSENKREKMKITIEFDGSVRAIECDGIAGMTLEDTGEGHKMSCLLMGNLSLGDLICLHENVEKELLKTLKKQVISDYFSETPNEIPAFLKEILGVPKED